MGGSGSHRRLKARGKAKVRHMWLRGARQDKGRQDAPVDVGRIFGGVHCQLEHACCCWTNLETKAAILLVEHSFLEAFGGVGCQLRRILPLRTMSVSFCCLSLRCILPPSHVNPAQCGRRRLSGLVRAIAACSLRLGGLVRASVACILTAGCVY